MNIVEALAFFNIVPERDIDSRIRARAPDGRVTQEILDGVRDEILELCKQEFRKRAKELHPDTGGDLEKMQLLNSMAAEVKKLEIRGQPACSLPPPPVPAQAHSPIPDMDGSLTFIQNAAKFA
jgi:hypothetical protein